ncbi:MAG: hypothetical protein WC488_04125 [Candidatus Micrarchaeia archaeon]
MNVKLIKKNGNSYLQLPEGFIECAEAELFHLREGFWLLSAGKMDKPRQPEQKAQPGLRLSQREIAVLRKLMGIRFADRTPSKVEKSFPKEDQEIVRQLIKKNVVQVFYGEKYKKTGVYNINNRLYDEIERAESSPAPPSPRQAQQPPQEQKAFHPAQPFLRYSELSKLGWMVISNPRDAEQFSFNLKNSGFSMNVKGVRGFDGRFYVATNAFVYAAYSKVQAVLAKKSEMGLAEIAQLTGLEPEAVLVVLRILAESGEVLEKKRDLFCLA